MFKLNQVVLLTNGALNPSATSSNGGGHHHPNPMQLLPVLTVAPIAAANSNSNNSPGNTEPTNRVSSTAGEPQATVQPVVNGSPMKINILGQSGSQNSNDITVYPWHSLVPFLTTATSLVAGTKTFQEEEKPPPPPSGDKRDNSGNNERSGAHLSNRFECQLDQKATQLCNGLTFWNSRYDKWLFNIEHKAEEDRMVDSRLQPDPATIVDNIKV